MGIEPRPLCIGVRDYTDWANLTGLDWEIFHCSLLLVTFGLQIKSKSKITTYERLKLSDPQQMMI